MNGLYVHELTTATCRSCAGIQASESIPGLLAGRYAVTSKLARLGLYCEVLCMQCDGYCSKAVNGELVDVLCYLHMYFVEILWMLLCERRYAVE